MEFESSSVIDLGIILDSKLILVILLQQRIDYDFRKK